MHQSISDSSQAAAGTVYRFNNSKFIIVKLATNKC